MTTTPIVSVPGSPWYQMTDEQIVDAVREIVRTSESDTQIRARIRMELHHNEALGVTSHRSGPYPMILVTMRGRRGMLKI